MILVAGSTGLVGGQICSKLTKADKPVRALVRSTSDRTKIETLKGPGIELAEGDLKDRSSLDSACAGVQTVVSTASSTLSHQAGDTIETVDRDGELNLIEAAKAAGARHFVFVSFPPFAEDFPLNRAKRAVEERLKESGMAYTTLWPTFSTKSG
jgi:uncharacterized protein YbjT (DUF2867 family)